VVIKTDSAVTQTTDRETAVMSTSKGGKRTQSSVAELISALASSEAVTRLEARSALVALGTPEATRALVMELNDPRRRVRWEAAKALTAIADPVAAAALVHALDDDDEDVRWVAAEGVAALGRAGLLTLLNSLTKRAGSTDFCRSAHHVLHDLSPRGFANVVAPVLAALDRSDPAVAAPPAAFAALASLKGVEEREALPRHG
jgi:HEAT repeat protein